MTTSDILFKLIPFTHKKSDGTVDFTTSLTLGDWIVTSIEIILLVIFFGSVIALYRSYKKDKKDILLLNSEIEKLEQEGFTYYNTLVENLKKSERVSHLWNEFHESLIKRDNTLENSIDADYFFNEKTLTSYVGSKFFSSISGILLGIGLLGTFFALYVALVELNLDGDNLKASIKTFIGMVGVKFTASVWGIFLSVLYTFFEKLLEGKISSQIHKLQNKIDDIFKRQTAEQNLFIIAKESQQQTQALNSLAETLTQRISEQFNPIISQMNTHLQKMPEDISYAIAESLKEPLSILSQNAKTAVESQSDNLEKLVQTFIDKIEHATGDQTDKIQTMMQNTTKELTQLINNLNETNSQMILHQKQQEKHISQTIEQMKNTLITITEQAGENISQVYSKQQKALQQQQEQLTQQSTDITNSMQDILEKIATKSAEEEEKTQKILNNFEQLQKELFESNQKLISNIQDSISGILDNIMSKTQQIQMIIENSATKLSVVPTLLQTFESSSNQLNSFAKNIQVSTIEFNDTIEKINQLQSLFNTQIEQSNLIIQNLKETSLNTNQITENVKQSAEKLHKAYNNIIEENHKNLEKLSDAMSHWIQSFDDQTHTTMQNSLNEVQAALSNFATTLTQSIASLEDAIESINEKLTK